MFQEQPGGLGRGCAHSRASAPDIDWTDAGPVICRCRLPFWKHELRKRSRARNELHQPIVRSLAQGSLMLQIINWAQTAVNVISGYLLISGCRRCSPSVSQQPSPGNRLRRPIFGPISGVPCGRQVGPLLAPTLSARKVIAQPGKTYPGIAGIQCRCRKPGEAPDMPHRGRFGFMEAVTGRQTGSGILLQKRGSLVTFKPRASDKA